MAISIFQVPGNIQPVYSVQEFGLYDAAREGSTGLYYQLDISIGGNHRYIKQLPDENKKAIIDVQNILQAFFTSETIVHSEFIKDTGNLKEYEIRADSYVGSVNSGDISTGFYVFNGVDLYNRTWDPSNFILFPYTNSSFLTNWDGTRELHYDDDLFFQFLKIDGISELGAFKITRTYFNGDTSIATIDLSSYYGSGDASILSVNLGPTSINTELGETFIDASTKSYTIGCWFERLKDYNVEITPVDYRYKDYYRIHYVNSLGATESFNFDLVPENNIKIDREKYVNDRITRTFGTKVQDSYLVRSGWMCEETSQALKELWHSPATSLYRDDINIPITLDEGAKQIFNRHNMKPINYTLSFTYAEEYTVQRS